MFSLIILAGLALLLASASSYVLSANAGLVHYTDTETTEMDAAALAHMYKSGFVGLTSGYARALVAGDQCAGIAFEECDNSAGDAGAKRVRVYREGRFERYLSGASAANNGAQLYASADDTLTTSSSGNSFVGQQIRVTRANYVEFELVIPEPVTPFARGDITQETGVYELYLQEWRAAGTLALLGNSAGTPANAFGVTPGTYGSATPIIVGEAASGNVKTDYGRYQFQLPPEYVAGQALTFRARAKLTTAATVPTSTTIDVEAYKADGEGGLGSDLCATAAQQLTASYANYDFTITPTGLAPGDKLDIRLTGLVTDTGGTTGATLNIGRTTLRAGIKG